MSKESWYKVSNSKTPLSQGDIFFNCPIVVPEYTPTEDTRELKAQIEEYNVVVLTQSCDLINNKINIALVSPVYTLSQLITEDPEFTSKRKKEKLRQGDYHSLHMLQDPSKKGFPKEIYIVNFHSVFGAPISLLNDLMTTQKRRLTLLSPYKEHLSQSFARFLMRVGLPSNIPPFT